MYTTFLKETHELFTLRCALASAACFTNGSHSWNWKPLPIIDFNIIVSISLVDLSLSKNDLNAGSPSFPVQSPFFFSLWWSIYRVNVSN